MSIASAPPQTEAIEWRTNTKPVPYDEAVSVMEARVREIRAGTAPELVWLLEHPALYTAGTSARDDDLVDPLLPVHHTGRGGQWTYHGPGQRIAYVMLDLNRRGGDLRAFVRSLEDWLIWTLAGFGVTGERRNGRIGIWVTDKNGAESKIAAIGVRVRRGVSYHGLSLNVAPNLDHYQGIVPCGVREHGVTSLAKLGIRPRMAEVDAALKANFAAAFP